MRLIAHARWLRLCPILFRRMISMAFLRLLAAVLLVVSPVLATPATAATFDITITGIFDGSLAGLDFSGRSLALTGTTDSDDTDEVFDEIQHPLSSLTVRLDGTEYRVTDAAIFFVSSLSGLAGIVDPDASRGLVRFDFNRNNAVIVDDLVQPFATSGGALRIGTGSGVAVRGVTLPTAAPAVPEPSSWTMMLLGFMLTGVVVRKSKVFAASRLPAA